MKDEWYYKAEKNKKQARNLLKTNHLFTSAFDHNKNEYKIRNKDIGLDSGLPDYI